MKRLFLLLISLVLVAVFVFTACEQKKGVTEKSEEPVSLRMVIWGAPKHVDMYNSLLDSYKENKPNIDIEVITAPYADFSEKIISMIASGNPPDVTWWSENTFSYFADEGFFLGLDEGIEQWGSEWDKDDFYPSTLEAGKWEGIQYALPFSCPAPVLYYNKKLFNEAGLKYPDENWTWDDCDNAINVLSKGSGANKVYGLDGIMTWRHALNMIRSYGGNFMNEDITKCIINSPESVTALKKFMKWVNKEQVTRVGMSARFEQEKVAMFIGWLSFNARFEGVEGLEYDISYLPKGPAGRRTVGGYAGIVLMKTSKYAKEGLDLMRFITSKEGIKAQSQYFGPPRKSVGLSTEFLNPATPPANKKIFIEALESTNVVEHFPQFAKVNPLIDQEFSKMVSGLQSVEDTLKNIESKTNGILGVE